MKISEKILIGLTIVGIILHLTMKPGGSILTILSLMSLSCIYFYLGFALFNSLRFREVFKKENYKDIATKEIVIAVFAGIGFGCTLIGVLFKLLFWPGSTVMLLFPSFLLIALLIVSLIIKEPGKAFYKNIFVRIVIMCVLVLVSYFTPTASIIKFKYSEYPDFANAMIENQKHHTPETQLKEDMERANMLEIKDGYPNPYKE